MVYMPFAANAPSFLSVPRGLLLEGERTNGNNNPRLEGAVVGVLGAGGALWTGGSVATSGGLSYEVRAVATDVVAGLEYVRLRIFGTPTGTTFQTNLANTIAALASQAWAASLFLRLVSGSTAGFGSINNRVVVTGGSGSFSQNTIPTLTSAWRRYSMAITTGAGATAVQHILSGAVTVGVPVEIELDIAYPQLGLGSFSSSVILPPVGAPGASTRGADLVSALLNGLGIGPNGACTLLGRFVIPQAAPSSASQIMFHLDDGTDNNRIMLRNSPGGTNILLTRTTAGVAVDSAAQSFTANTSFATGMSVDGAGGAIFCVNGATPLAIAGAPTSGFTTFRLGANSGGTGNLFGVAQVFGLLPYPLAAGPLQTAVNALPVV